MQTTPNFNPQPRQRLHGPGTGGGDPGRQRGLRPRHHAYIRISHLIVMEDTRIVGVISFHDIARACLKEAYYENSLLKCYIKNSM